MLSKCHAQAADPTSHIQRAAALRRQPPRCGALKRAVYLDPAAGEELVPVPPAKPLVRVREDRPFGVDATEILPILLAARVRGFRQHCDSFARG